jgi:hypothetical protein
MRVSAHAEFHHVHELQCEGGPPTKEAALLLHDGGLQLMALGNEPVLV